MQVEKSKIKIITKNAEYNINEIIGFNMVWEETIYLIVLYTYTEDVELKLTFQDKKGSEFFIQCLKSMSVICNKEKKFDVTIDFVNNTFKNEAK